MLSVHNVTAARILSIIKIFDTVYVITDEFDHFEEKFAKISKNSSSKRSAGTIIPNPDPTWPKSSGSVSKTLPPIGATSWQCS